MGYRIDEDGLTDKQRMFCHEYMVDLNGTQAAIRAGYSKDTAPEIASENLRKPKVEAKIQELMDLRAKRTEITADRVLVELAKIGFADIRSIFNEDGTLKKPTEYDDDTAASISSVEIVMRQSSDGKGDKTLDEIHKVRLSDKKAALEALGKNLKIFTDKQEISGSVSHDHKVEFIGVSKDKD